MGKTGVTLGPRTRTFSNSAIIFFHFFQGQIFDGARSREFSDAIKKVRCAEGYTRSAIEGVAVAPWVGCPDVVMLAEHETMRRGVDGP